MSSTRTSTRAVIAGLLVAAAALFLIGTSIEAAERDEHQDEGTVEETHSDDAGAEGEQARVLGIDATSPAVRGAGIALSIAAAAAVLWRRERWIVLGVAAFAGVFGALDIAEAVHGIREGEATIAVLALVIAVLHVIAACLAFGLANRDRANDRAASLRE